MLKFPYSPFSSCISMSSENKPEAVGVEKFVRSSTEPGYYHWVNIKYGNNNNPPQEIYTPSTLNVIMPSISPLNIHSPRNNY